MASEPTRAQLQAAVRRYRTHLDRLKARAVHPLDAYEVPVSATEPEALVAAAEKLLALPAWVEPAPTETKR